MLKQTPSRNQRSKGFKVKHILQICLLLVLCIWLLSKLIPCHDNNNDGDNTDKTTQNPNKFVKLGRKDLHNGQDGENHGELPELEDDLDDIKSGELDEEGRGGGDDEIDGHDQDRAEEEEAEEVEDLIDVDDRDRDEDESSGMENKDKQELQKNSRAAREEHYKGDDASSSVLNNIRKIRTEFKIGIM